MTEELVTITVDGQELKAPKGAMLISVTDRENIRVPRFCYHEKLSVAANCRMCLVEVEKAPKPLPACATPIMEGMVVHTRSAAAKAAQQSVMEFLLINHPLDCPICDQGGECELQDVAMAYGQDASQYTETKRVVFDKSIGPLIATELTRCIHCTRCVRFGEEIAGVRELGMTSRGEHARIATFMNSAVTSELSGNVIDLCPVGALTAKPSRYSARAWEMIQHASIAPHDCVGSNIFVHTFRNDVVRVVPRDNESINEVWISDRDRFSYEGVDSAERLTTPMVKHNGEWKATDWDTAMGVASDRIKALLEDEAAGADTIAALVSPGSTLEELYLAQKLMRSMGSGNIDHRLRQSDFSDQDMAPVMPWLGQNIEDLEALNAALLIGSNVRKEQPIIGHRLRKAVVNHGAQISFINPRAYEINFPVANSIAVAQQHLAGELALVAAAAYKASKHAMAAHLKKMLTGLKPDETHKAIVAQLKSAEKSTVLLGNLAAMHPNYSALRALAGAIATETDSVLGYLSEGANSAGAWLAGAVPHRGVAGAAAAPEAQTEEAESDAAEAAGVVTGYHAGELKNRSPSAVILLNVEPDLDSVHAISPALEQADMVVAISAYDSPALRECANVLLPAGSFTETSGTFVNVEGFWQNFKGIRQPQGEARPAWKILRVLANLLEQKNFDYMSSQEVRDELRAACENIELSNAASGAAVVEIEAVADGLMRAGDVPMYAGDALLRRATSLQKASDAQSLCVRLNAQEAARLGVADGETVAVSQGELSARMDLLIDDSIPEGSAWIPLALKGSELLGDAFAAIKVEKAES
ncbi:MAG: NADH-quinone oxidoreductase subunit NuoG [Gammaproteobacteria bacterium]|jgi:NADH-quinone oxidoreductase subunit G|nr:NADH-quinone oxidoreductase subunit NuoG [Gammaproteobacteria bacterium]